MRKNKIIAFCMGICCSITIAQASNIGSVGKNCTPLTVEVNSSNICEGGLATVTATPSVEGVYTYNWVVPSGVTTPGNTVSSFSTNVAGTYSVTIYSNIDPICQAEGMGTVTINALTAPTFAQLGPYCQNDSPDELEMTSLNDIPGTWSPLNISTSIVGTQTYTFTPTSLSTPICATTTQMMVTVNGLTTPTFEQHGPYCQNDSSDELEMTSLNGIPGTWNPAAIGTSNPGNEIYTFTPTSPSSPTCATTTQMMVTVNALTTPTFEQHGPYCQNDSPDELEITSLNGIPGTWNPAAISTSNPGNEIYTFTPTSPSSPTCETTTQMMVTVNALTTPTFAQLGPYCQKHSPDELEMTSLNGISGTWNPTAISTSTAGNEICTFTPASTSSPTCATSTEMSVVVNAPTIPTFAQHGPYCQNDSPDVLEMISLNDIPGTWNPAAISTSNPGNEIYTFTPTSTFSPTCATIMMITIVVSPLPNAGTISGADAQCSGINADTLFISGNSVGNLQWYNGTSQDTFELMQGQILDSLVVSNLQDSAYYQIVASTAGCVSDTSDFAVIPIEDNDMVSYLPESIEMCAASIELFVADTSYSTTWFVDGLAVDSMDAFGFSEEQPGEYVVSNLSRNNSGCAIADSVSIVVNPIPEQVVVELLTPGLLGFEGSTPYSIEWGATGASTGIEQYQSSANNYYFYNSFDPLNNYYWVEFTNDFGCSNRSYYNEPAAIIESAQPFVSFYPNPAFEVLSVNCGQCDGMSFEYSIFDALGRLNLSGEINAENTTINVGTLSTGLYVLSLNFPGRSYSLHLAIR